MRAVRWKPALMIGVSVLLLMVLVLPLAAQGKVLVPYSCPPCQSIGNAFVRADVSPSGLWAMGTTGGDPSTPDDDAKRLIYRYESDGTSHLGSGYATIRVSGDRGTKDIVPGAEHTEAVVSDTTSITTTWLLTVPYSMRVLQTLELAPNPYSGRDDVVKITYGATNTDSVTVTTGFRALLDVMIGNNDGAPYQVPGLGAVTHERDFVGSEVPPFWLAFESETLDPRMVRSVGILKGPDVVAPDRFIIASWRHIKSNVWKYDVSPGQSVVKPNDSAVALYWDPIELGPGESREVTTKYGLAGQGGGAAFLTAENTDCDATIPVSLFVSNFDTEKLTGGQATLTLPSGLTLSPGETATKPIADIDPGGTGSAVWSVDVGATVSGSKLIAAQAKFDANKDFDAQHKIQVSCQQPTATITTVPPTLTPTPTFTPPTPSTSTPTTPSPTPSSCARPCTYIRGRVPDHVINDALASPEDVIGWGMLANPNRPPSRFNPPRCMLSLLNVNVPFNPVHNPVVYKAGCP